MKRSVQPIVVSIFRWLIATAAAALCLCALVPLFMMGIVNHGTYALLIVFAPTLLFALFPALFRHIRSRRAGRILLCAVAVLLCCIALYCAVMTGAMLVACAQHPPADATAPLVVLGCQVYPSGPSPILLQRLEEALVYLQAHPNVICVVSGGQGTHEFASEASVMAEWLIARGIDANRILLEDVSRNTEQNLQFTVQLLREKEIPFDSLVIVTDWWHQWRARIWTARQGVAYYSRPCATYPPVGVLYYARELCGTVRMLLMGY